MKKNNTWHINICDFNLIYKDHEFVYKKCNDYLKKHDMKREFHLWQCNTCPHFRKVTISKDGFILDIK